jgi:hypothetical protein
MKAGGKQSNQLAEISDYIGNRREIEDSKSVPIGLSVGQNELLVPIGSHTQLSEPIGDKNRITSMALRRAGCAGLGKDGSEVVRMWWQRTEEYGREVMCLGPRQLVPSGCSGSQ